MLLLYNKQFWYCVGSPLDAQWKIRFLKQTQLRTTDLVYRSILDIKPITFALPTLILNYLASITTERQKSKVLLYCISKVCAFRETISQSGQWKNCLTGHFMRLIFQGCNYRQQGLIFSQSFFLSFFPCSVNQCLYVLWAADYSAYALWCFPRCRSNLFFCTVQHIMGVCESCLSRSSELVTAFQVGCSPSPLHHSLLLFFFMLLFTHLPLSPLFYAWYLSSSRFPLGSSIVRLPTPYLLPARLSPLSPQIVSHQTRGLVGNGCANPPPLPASLMLVKPVGMGTPVLITLIKGSLVPLAMPRGALERKEKICQMAWMSLR